MSDAYRFKFRVWDSGLKCYRDEEIFMLTHDGKLVFLNPSNGKLRNSYRFSVEQCTGLSDANGRLIYEGDIIAGEDPNCSHLVEWDEKEATFYVVLLPTTKITTIRGTIRKDWIDEFQKHVIGNIHENPELLEDKK